MKISVLGQGYEPESENAVGKHLKKFFSQKGFHTFTGISAFASEGAVKHLTEHIQQAKNIIENLNLIVGIDQQGTSKEALYEIYKLRINSYVFYQREAPIFHPKIYLFEGQNETRLIVGSSNLTLKGLFTNVESSLLVEFSNDDEEGRKLLSELKDYFNQLFEFNDPNLFKITPPIIEGFVADGIVPTEAARLTRDRKRKPKTPPGQASVDVPARQTAKFPKSLTSRAGINIAIDKFIEELELEETGPGKEIIARLNTIKTESSYHFPQGTHLGHILYILAAVGAGNLEQTRLRSNNVRFAGGYDAGEAGHFQRETKYKLQAAMEMGILVDFRKYGLADNFKLAFTVQGRKMDQILKPLLDETDLSFANNDSWAMNGWRTVNSEIREFLANKPIALHFVRSLLLGMDAPNLLLRFLYEIKKGRSPINKSEIYDNFFQAPFVRRYLGQYGFRVPPHNVIIRRLPFLFNILEALGILNQTPNSVEILRFIPTPDVLRFNTKEKDDVIRERIAKLNIFAGTQESHFSEIETARLRKLFGAKFLTEDYYLTVERI